MLPYVVGIVSVMVGIVAAAIEAIICLVISPQSFEAIAKKDFEGMAIMTGFCATGFAVAYAVGRFLYRKIGEANALAELERFSRPHVTLLHLLAATYMLVAIVEAMRQGNWLRPTLVIGVVLFVLAAWEFAQLWRARWRREMGTTNGRR